MANLTVYTQALKLSSVDRHLRYPGKLRRSYDEVQHKKRGCRYRFDDAASKTCQALHDGDAGHPGLLPRPGTAPRLHDSSLRRRWQHRRRFPRHLHCQCRAVQVDPIKPMLKAPGTERLKLEYDGTPSNFAFKFNLRRHTTVTLLYSGVYSISATMRERTAGAYTRPLLSST